MTSGIRLTIEYCKDFALKKGCELLSDTYINEKTKMKFINHSCGHIFVAKWNSFSKNHKNCPVCWGSKKIELNYCKKEALKNEYEILSKAYVGSNNKLNFIHLKDNCNYIFEMSWHNFSKGHGCPKCSFERNGSRFRHTLDFRKKQSEHMGYIMIAKEWVHDKVKIKFMHISCGKIFERNWNDFYYLKRGCRHCASNRQESEVAYELKKYFGTYYNSISEYKECLNPETGRFLPYDIFIKKNNIKFYVEVNGLQHYNKNSLYNKTNEDFEYLKYKDYMKKKHAKENGIFIEIDLRKIKTINQWIKYVEEIIEKEARNYVSI